MQANSIRKPVTQALYEEEVINRIWQKLKVDRNSNLITCIVIDHVDGQVLMQAYQNQEAFQTSLASGLMNYYSRSRKCQWLKGDTSGHYQIIKRVQCDCDCDCLLYTVEQIGAACHTGAKSCFYRNLEEVLIDE